jgi:hypothetical protein
MPGFLRELRQKFARMKIGDHVYLITDPLTVGAGLPGMICALQDCTIEVLVEFTHGPTIFKVSNRDDLVAPNLFTHSILNLVYQAYEEIEHKYGSILNLTAEQIVTRLIERGLAPQTARRCVDLIDQVAWQNAQLPLRHWLESIRDFFYRSGPPENPIPSPTCRRLNISAAVLSSASAAS